MTVSPEFSPKYLPSIKKILSIIDSSPHLSLSNFKGTQRNNISQKEREMFARVSFAHGSFIPLQSSASRTYQTHKITSVVPKSIYLFICFPYMIVSLRTENLSFYFCLLHV